MKTILAIGGATIKTAYPEMKEVAERKMFDVLVHNGASIFHDFQLATENLGGRHSYSLDEIKNDLGLIKKSSELVWDWVLSDNSPEGSLTSICDKKRIPCFMFTGLGCDFWQIATGGSLSDWRYIGETGSEHFRKLSRIMSYPFHFVNLGSAVIHPEVFTKIVAFSKPRKFRADTVDFLDMYRPRTRIARYGKYYKMQIRDYLRRVLDGDIKWGEMEMESQPDNRRPFREGYPRFMDSTGDG